MLVNTPAEGEYSRAPMRYSGSPPAPTSRAPLNRKGLAEPAPVPERGRPQPSYRYTAAQDAPDAPRSAAAPPEPPKSAQVTADAAVSRHESRSPAGPTSDVRDADPPASACSTPYTAPEAPAYR